MQILSRYVLLRYAVLTKIFLTKLLLITTKDTGYFVDIGARYFAGWTQLAWT